METIDFNEVMKQNIGVVEELMPDRSIGNRGFMLSSDFMSRGSTDPNGVQWSSLDWNTLNSEQGSYMIQNSKVEKNAPTDGKYGNLLVFGTQYCIQLFICAQGTWIRNYWDRWNEWKKLS